MAKTKKLKALIQRGDYPVIAEIFNTRHSGIDQRTITSSYVGKLIRGDYEAPISYEVREIANVYLKKKRSFERELASI